MNLILAIEPEHPNWEEELRKRGCAVATIPLPRLTAFLKNNEDHGLLADAVICFAQSDFAYDAFLPTVSLATKVEAELQSLPDTLAMPDGRKWKSIPFLILVEEIVLPGDVYFDRYKKKILRYEKFENAFFLIQNAVKEYRERLLSELDNLGFLVKVENGRYRVGPALKPKENLESELYYGLQDRRDDRGKAKYFTVDRDLYGIQYEIEQFEALINKADVTEGDLQRFFEDNPHFLVITQLMQALPHVRLEAEGGKLLIPDFVLKPILALKRDSIWEVLDLKTPQAKLLTGKAQRVQFSHQVMKSNNPTPGLWRLF